MRSYTSHMQIAGSSVSGPYYAVRVTGDATVEGDEAQDVEAFAAPGIVFRPRLPEYIKGDDGQTRELGAEAIAVVVGEELVPVGWRDLRLHKVFPAPKPGTHALVGYGGGFIALDDVLAGGATCSVLTQYIPYNFDEDGVPQKSMAIIIDPSNESIRLIHGDGMAILMENGNVIIRNGAGNAYIQIHSGGIVINGNVKLVGGLDIGGSVARTLVTGEGLAAALTTIVSTLNAAPAAPVTNATLAAVLAGLSSVVVTPAVSTVTTKGT